MKNKGLKPEDWTPGEKVVLYGFRDGKLSALPESGSGLHMRTARVIRAYPAFIHLEFFWCGRQSVSGMLVIPQFVSRQKQNAGDE